MKPGIKPIHNLKNTCFINSAIQLLTHIDPLKEIILSIDDSQLEDSKFK